MADINNYVQCKKHMINKVICSICEQYFCVKCLNMKYESKDQPFHWMCKHILPFYDLKDYEFKQTIKNENDEVLKNCSEFNFNPFSYTEHNYFDYEDDIDPDNNFYNSINVQCHYYTDEKFMKSKFVKSNEKGLSIIHFNGRSLKANLDKIVTYLKLLRYNFDIIAISETGVKDELTTDFDINGYNVKHITRKNTKSGGVSMYIKQELDYKVLHNMTIDIENVMECLTVEIKVKTGKNIIVSCVYRKCNTDIKKFNDHLFNVLSNVNNVKKSFFVCGDFNIDLLKYDKNEATKMFVDMMYGFGLYSLINKPSRITKYSSTLIDNIFTNNVNCTDNMYNGILISDVTDHLPIFVICNQDVKRKNATFVKHVRNISDTCIENLKQNLIEQNWDSVYQSENVNSAYNTFINIFQQLYDKNCPVKQQKAKCTNFKEDKPWFTKGLINACRKKNNLYKEYIKLKTTVSETKYKMYKNKLTAVLRRCEKDYYSKLLEEHKNDVKGTWQVLNSIIKKSHKMSNYPETFIHNNTPISDKKGIANGFNHFFTNIGPNLAKKIVPPKEGNIYNYLNNCNSSSMFLYGTDEEEVLKVVNQCKSKKSCDYNGVNMSTLKNVFSGLVKPFTFICNNSFKEGTFPEKMKIAKIVPLYKSGEKDIFTNYRPVSLLSQFSKILEKLFNSRLEKFIDLHHILSDSQFGFRKNHSTNLALLELMEQITDSFENKKTTIGTFIDLSKAFDTIDHKLLFKKLEFYGIRGTPLEWLKSYLLNREQFVQIDETVSDRLKVLCGVPQGSVLGPKLFILYINDICNVSKFLSLIIFADDTNLFCTGDNISEITSLLNRELELFVRWFALNKLSLNVNKTNFIVFTNKKICNDPSIYLNGNLISRVTNTKFLGIFIDEKLNWKDQINHVKSKLSKSLAIMYKAKPIVNEQALYTLYNSLFLPYLTYCIEVWGSTYKTTIQPLFIMQKRAVRIICNKQYRDHTQELFIEKKILKLHDLIKVRIGAIMFKARHMMLPPRLQMRFEFVHESEIYNMRRNNYFKVKQFKTSKKEFSISVCGPNIWKDLQDEIKNAKNLKSFLKKYKDSKLTVKK